MDVKEEVPMVYLKAGEMHFTKAPARVVTVLGSCLTVTMFSRRHGFGGMCHGLLPQCRHPQKCAGDCPDGFKYVECSIRRMVKLFERHGVERSELEIKCFGGADMFTRVGDGRLVVSVGKQNIAIAQKVLSSEGLRMTVSDVGGLEGRKIIFDTHTGEVLLKRLKNQGHQKE